MIIDFLLIGEFSGKLPVLTFLGSQNSGLFVRSWDSQKHKVTPETVHFILLQILQTNSTCGPWYSHSFFRTFFYLALYNHLKNVYSSIKFLHLALNQPFLEEEYQVNTVLQAIKRKIARVPFQVLPITPKILCDMYNFIDLEKPSDLALWSSFLVAFYCLFRKSNVAPKSLETFNPSKELSRQKVSILDTNGIVLVYSNWSKTNQFMNRDAVIPLIKNRTRALDPFFHLKELFCFTIPHDKPAFSYFEHGTLKCITYDFFTRRLKYLLSMAGYSPGLYSGHSMRRGGCTLLFQMGCDPLLIQALGDWSTDQFLKYCGLSLEQRFNAQLLMSSIV